MDLYDLRDARFEGLGTAVDDWEAMVKKLEALEKDARQGLKGLADKANWKGVNASVGKEFIGKTAKEFDDAHTEATTVHNILRDTHSELVSYQKQLHEALDEADRKNLMVSCSEDQVTVSLKTAVSGRLAYLPYEDDVQAMLTRIMSIMENANESDSSAAKVLDELMKQRRYGFSDVRYKDRDSAVKAVEDAEKDAEKYADLMKTKGDNMSPAELKELNKILLEHRNDPVFQERLAQRLGPRGLLNFWMDISDPTDKGQLQKLRDSGQFAELQKNLGMVLAGATQSDSPAMRKWENDIVHLGSQKFTAESSSPLSSRAYGFQLMSNLMRTGNWDKKFLDVYGNALVATEKKNGSETSLWNEMLMPGPESKVFPAQMNFIGQDNGLDPMGGVMEAMANSPEESANFFSNKANARWVLNDRPVFDTIPNGHEDKNPALEAAGRALQAATMGVNPSDPHPYPVEHTAANQLALRNTLSVLAQAGDEMHPELRDDMAAVLVNHGPEFLNTANAETDTDDDGRPDLLLDRQDMRQVTKQIARDGGAYHMLFDGMSKVVEQDINATDYRHPETALRNAGGVFGYLEENRVEAIGNDKPDTSWATQWASTGVSVVGDFLPVGDNTFSAAGGLIIKAVDDNQQDTIDAAAIQKVQEQYNIRTKGMDQISQTYEQRYPQQDLSRREILDRVEDGVNGAKDGVQMMAGVTPSKSG